MVGRWSGYAKGTLKGGTGRTRSGQPRGHLGGHLEVRLIVAPKRLGFDVIGGHPEGVSVVVPLIPSEVVRDKIELARAEGCLQGVPNDLHIPRPHLVQCRLEGTREGLDHVPAGFVRRWRVYNSRSVR